MENHHHSLINAFPKWEIWFWFARQDIKARYRGSVLGPFWIVLNLGILVTALSLIYSTVFGLSLDIYAPYLASGFLVWWFISGVMNESCSAFTDNSNIVRNMRLPLGIHVLRVVARNAFLMLHNFIIFIVTAILFGITPTLNTLLIIPGLILVFSIMYFTGTSLAIICTRYRDVPHIISSAIQVTMFITPIMFMKDMLHRQAFPADANPFYHIIESIRAPMLGQAPQMTTWLFLTGLFLISLLTELYLVRRAGHRIPYLV